MPMYPTKQIKTHLNRRNNMWQYNNTLSHYGKVGMKWGKRGVSKADYKSIKKKAVNDFKNDRNKAAANAKTASKNAKGTYSKTVNKMYADELGSKYVAKKAFTSAVVSAAITAASLVRVRDMSAKQKVALVAGSAAVSGVVGGAIGKREQNQAAKAKGVASVRSRIEEGLKKR